MFLGYSFDSDIYSVSMLYPWYTKDTTEEDYMEMDSQDGSSDMVIMVVDHTEEVYTEKNNLMNISHGL